VETLDIVLRTFLIVWALLNTHTVLYGILGIILPAKKFKKCDDKKSFAIIIAARNEEYTVNQLINSLKKQNYPADKITVFIAAHNCTDRTVEIVREREKETDGVRVVVYEYNNNKERRKGYPLRYMFEQIKKDYPNGIMSFDGYIVIDADNIVPNDFVENVNDAFANKRYDMFNCYINIRNFGDSAMSSFGSITRFSDNVNQSRPRAHLGVARRTVGIGAVYRAEFLASGWKWVSLVEDAEMSIEGITRGCRVSFVESAQYYDEQPLTMKIFYRQRMRWTKGRFHIFLRLFPFLLLGIIAPYDFFKKRRMRRAFALQQQIHGEENVNRDLFFPKKERRYGIFSGTLKEIQTRFSCYDNALSIFPNSPINFFYGFVYPFVMVMIATFSSYNIDLGPMWITVFAFYSVRYTNLLTQYIVTIVREHKRMRVNPILLMLYMPIWPIFSFILDYVEIWALLVPVYWKRIPHIDRREIEDVMDEPTIAEQLYSRRKKTKEGAI